MFATKTKRLSEEANEFY